MVRSRTLILRILTKGRCLGTHGFTKKTVLVGRSPRADLRMDHPGVSREHARIHQRGGEYVLEDEGSTNGTLVNRRRVFTHVLMHGDVIQIGRFLLQVSFEGTPDSLPHEPSAEHWLYAVPTVRVRHLRHETLSAS